MDGMNNGVDMHGMGGRNGMISPSSSPMSNNISGPGMMMHMTFFWGKNTEILFNGWPGPNNTAMYAVALVFVFVLAVIVEWLSHCNLIRQSSNHVAVGLVQTLMHGLRVGLAYMVMLAVMSFNVGVFLVAVAGHALGFMVFGSRVFKKWSRDSGNTSDLPPMSC